MVMMRSAMRMMRRTSRKAGDKGASGRRKMIVLQNCGCLSLTKTGYNYELKTSTNRWLDFP